MRLLGTDVLCTLKPSSAYSPNIKAEEGWFRTLAELVKRVIADQALAVHTSQPLELSSLMAAGSSSGAGSWRSGLYQ